MIPYLVIGSASSYQSLWLSPSSFWLRSMEGRPFSHCISFHGTHKFQYPIHVFHCPNYLSCIQKIHLQICSSYVAIFGHRRLLWYNAKHIQMYSYYSANEEKTWKLAWRIYIVVFSYQYVPLHMCHHNVSIRGHRCNLLGFLRVRHYNRQDCDHRTDSSNTLSRFLKRDWSIY